MLYTKSSLDRVRAADTLQVISHFVEMKKAGANYQGLSPFKSEKTPSFTYSPAKDIWKCFATGKGGNDAISFVMAHENVEFIQAVKTVAEICNIHLEIEHQSEEAEKAYSQRNKLKALNNNVAEEYARQFTSLPNTHWAKQHIQSLGYTQDEIIMFQIGYAPGNLVSKAVVKSAKLDLAVTLGLVNTKSGTSYDFFFDRIIFPIHDSQNNVIGFGGRCSRDKQTETAKYLNSKDSDVFNKSTTLYGLRQARKEIVKTETAILVEGYTDVITMHQHNKDNTIATCGTALTVDHAILLKRLANHIIVFRDGDEAGIKALHRDIDILLKTGKKISVIVATKGEDPDTICRTGNISEFIENNLQDAVEWKANYFLTNEGDTPTDKISALKQTVETLANIESELTRKEYYKTISKLYKHSVRDIDKEVKQFIAKREAAAKKQAAKSMDKEQVLGLPKGADIEEWKEKGYLTIGNSFWVQGKEGWQKASDFKMTPLFHVEGEKDTSRLFDVVNERGEKSLVEVESSLLLNLTQMQARLFDYGVYRWDINLSALNFKLIMSQLIRQFIRVKPFNYFGWQTKGFWAFANGVFYNNEFHEVNEYGIVSVEGLEEIESDYYNNTPYFYSPAYNVTNRYKEDEQDQYQNDRAFVFKKAPITFETWMLQMSKVYDEKANIAIAFSVATMFKDVLMNRYSYFPLLFCSGEKGSGKSAFSTSIANLFTYKQQAFQIDSGSKVGFFRRLQRGKNTATIMEEFHDKIDAEKFQALKGAWDGRGREIGMMTNDSRTKVSDVRCSLVLVGQYLSSRDDNSLTSRSIIEIFQKPTEQFEDIKIQHYNQLREWEDVGLTSLVLEVVKYRNEVETNFHTAFMKNSKAFKRALKNFEYQERMLQNYNAIYTPVQLLYDKLKFPFQLDVFFEQCVEGILTNSDRLVESEGLSEFWNIISKLAENDRLRHQEHYLIDTPLELKIETRKGEAPDTWKNTNRKRVLYLRAESVHQDYADAASKRDSVDVIGLSTLRTYFKSKRYFIGSIKAKHFRTNPRLVTSCYAFDYDMMADNNILNLPDFYSKALENEAQPIADDIDEDNPLIPTEEDDDKQDLFNGAS